MNSKLFTVFILIFLVEFFCQTKAAVGWNSPIDGLLNDCAGNIPQFASCKRRLIATLKLNRNPINVDLKVTYNTGSLITWEPLNRLSFLRFCRVSPQFNACLNVPGVRNACPNEPAIKLLDLASYFCQPERRDEFLESLQCIRRIQREYEVDECVRSKFVVTEPWISEGEFICRLFGVALPCSRSYIVENCGQNAYDFIVKAADDLGDMAIPYTCDLNAELQNRK